jgi:hypothetical protein
MPKQGDVHVVYAKAGKAWRIEITGNNRASGSYATKPAAVAQGRQLASKNRSELVIHNQDGKIGERRSYGAGTKKGTFWDRLSGRDREAVLEMLDQDESTPAKEFDERAERIRQLTGESSS